MTVESTLKSSEIATCLVQVAIKKHRDRYENTFIKAIMAGVLLSFGGLLSQVVSAGSPGLTASNPGLVKLLSGFVFPVGLVMIVLQGAELLTSNMMVFPMAILTKELPVWSLPVNWFIVFFGNLVGSLFFAAVLVRYTGVVAVEPYASAIKSFAMHKAADPHWHQIFLRGVGCNWLVCVAIWQALGAKDTISKIFAIWIPIWVFVACGFDHVVANMFSVPLGIMLGADLTTVEYIRKSMISAFLGNAVGALFVALPAWYLYLRDVDDKLRAAEDGRSIGHAGSHVSNIPNPRGSSQMGANGHTANQNGSNTSGETRSDNGYLKY